MDVTKIEIEQTLKEYQEKNTPESAKQLFRLHNRIFINQYENPDSISCYGCRVRVQNKIINYLKNLV